MAIVDSPGSPSFCLHFPIPETNLRLRILVNVTVPRIGKFLFRYFKPWLWRIKTIVERWLQVNWRERLEYSFVCLLEWFINRMPASKRPWRNEPIINRTLELWHLYLADLCDIAASKAHNKMQKWPEKGILNFMSSCIKNYLLIGNFIFWSEAFVITIDIDYMI